MRFRRRGCEVSRERSRTRTFAVIQSTCANDVSPSGSQRDARGSGRDIKEGEWATMVMGEERAKWVLLAYGLFMTTLVAGVVYGWQSFRAVFIAEGVLDEGCASDGGDGECPSQAKELGVIFACGAWSVQACRMVTGLARDRYGTRVCVVGVMLIVAVGIVLLAVSPSQSLALFCVGYFLLGIGAGVQLCMQSISMLFGKYQGAASATLSGAFTLSAVIPLVCAEGIKSVATGPDGTSYADARLGVLMVWCVTVVVFAASALWLMPKGGEFRESVRYLAGKKADDDDDEAKKKIAKEEKEDEGAPPPAHAPPANGHRRAPHEGKSAREQLVSLDFIFLAVWFTVMLLPTNYFIISVGDQLEDMGDGDGTITRGFQLVWVLSTVLSPLAGYSADVVGRGSTMTLAMGCYAASFAMLGFGDERSGLSLNAQWINFVCFNVGRLWVFSMYFVSVGRLFGFKHYGTLAGAGLLLSAMSTPLAVPMHQSGVDGGFGVANLASAMICLALTPYTVGWAWRREVTEEGMRGFPARWGIDERDTAPEDDGENRV